ncbi:MAG: PQQ-binding-like beta-propeller repeat protein [candidate division WOR-3 bacterium]|nr:PQQ-binding-like beta-propeller repeat protein [candidate division WOR-3 bacterium]
MAQFKIKLIFLSIIIILMAIDCGDKAPPLVNIINPVDGSFVDGMVQVAVEATDNKGVDSIEIYIDDSLIFGTGKSYGVYMWNTTPLPHNSSHKILACACDFSGNVGISDTITVSVIHPGTLAWCYKATGAIQSCPAIDDEGAIYFGENNGFLYALDKKGVFKWYHSFAVGFSPTRSSPVISAGGMIYFAEKDSLYALSVDGSIQWTIGIGFVERCVPAIGVDGTIYIGAIIRGIVTHYYFYAIQSDGSIKWCYEGCAPTCSAPVIGIDGTIYFGDDHGYIYAFNPDGVIKWRYQSESNSSSPAVDAQGIIYCGSGSYLYALNSDGTLRWRYQTGGAIQSSPAIAADGTIYFGSDDGYLYAICGLAPLANTPWPKFHHDLKNTGRKGGN